MQALADYRKEGTSPPAWGNPVVLDHARKAEGHIPTRVGEPTFSRRLLTHRGAHPHPRGGTWRRRFLRRPRLGTSPPAWGNPSGKGGGSRGCGHIPTRVGEPLLSRLASSLLGAHPHPRGGTLNQLSVSDIAEGTSPPAWGNRPSAKRPRPAPGHIPTRVGEPTAVRRLSPPLRAHPHPRGGTWAKVK